MSILIDATTRVLIQGITGKEGSRAAHDMIRYGTSVIAGVTPGKGGILTEDGIPVFNSVHESRTAFPEINATVLAVPARFARQAACDAIEEHIPLVNIFTEGMPVADVAQLLRLARDNHVRVVGPSSVGIVSPGVAKLGSIGGGAASSMFRKGPVGVISKSGGMTAEISRILTEHSIGQSTVLGIGGDIIICSDFLSIAKEFERDSETKALVIFGEVGGVYEHLLAEAIIKGEITKPVIALIAGRFSDHLPEHTAFGHAGAIVKGENETATAKINALSRAGAQIAYTPEEIPILLKKVL